MKNRSVIALLFSSGLAASLAGLGCASTAPPASALHGGQDLAALNLRLEAEIHELLHTPRPWLPSAPPEGSTDMPPFAACFDPDNPPTPETMARVNTLIRNSLAKYNADDRWTNTSLAANVPNNSPVTLRVSFVPDTVNAPDLDNSFGPSTLFATMDAKFGGNRALWISKIQAAFDRWSALTGVSYVWVNAPGADWDDGANWGQGGSATRGDVRIAMRAMDGVNGVLAFNSYPNQGDMVLDSAENWQSSSNNYRFLRNIIMHEHGHGLGLAHVCPIVQTKLMEPNYTGVFDGPQQDDLRGIQFRYGDVNEPNNTLATATVVGAINPGQSFTIGTVPAPSINNGSVVSLTTNGDQDWYRFDPSASTLITATVTPLGTTYDAAEQTGGSCPSGSPVNALAQADVAVAIIGSNGTTVFGSATGAAIGLAETDAGVLVPAATPFYVKVYETGNQSQSQMYRLAVSASGTISFNASDGTYFDGVHLSWSAITGVTSYSVWRSETNNRLAALPVGTVTTTSYLDTSAESGHTYYYWLRAGQGANPAMDVAGPDAGTASPCKADLGKQGGAQGFDGALDNNDFISFINSFFGSDPRADFGSTGGVPGADGVFDNNDFIVFITAFFAGC